MKRWIIFGLLIFSLGGFAQSVDTVTVMTYNVLFYGANTSFCTTANNNLQVKNGHLRNIVQYAQPDIIGVQEMANNVGTTLTFLNEVLNHGGETRWARANFMNTTSSNILSILYYDRNKFSIASQQPIQTQLRDIMYYRLYYTQIPPAGDTIFLNVVVMHLKAGSSASDVSARGLETQTLMNHLQARGLRENLVVMGDFNCNSSSEAGYANMITNPNTNIRLLDPVNRLGAWFNNVAFADLHTQSPRVTSTGCHVGGGMDDRYDQILINEFVRADSARVRYVQGSHRVIGNDGQRFKGNVNSPTNASVPVGLADALFVASDHLPVIVKLRMDAGFGLTTPERLGETFQFACNTWVTDAIHYQVSTAQESHLSWQLRSVTGQLLQHGVWPLDAGSTTGSIDGSGLKAGIYLLQLSAANGYQKLIRLVKP